jgi:hypothetical protein
MFARSPKMSILAFYDNLVNNIHMYFNKALANINIRDMLTKCKKNTSLFIHNKNCTFANVHADRQCMGVTKQNKYQMTKHDNFVIGI